MTESEIFEIVKMWLEPISIIIAACTAIYGINSWRRETKWKRLYELGEDVLVLVYEFHQAMRFLRNPWRHGPETEMKELEVIRSRHDKRADTFNKLQTLKFRFMVVYGKSSEIHFKQLESLLDELFRTAYSLDFNYNKRYEEKTWSTEEEKDKLLQKKHAAEGIIWQTSLDDEFDVRIKNVVTEFERIWQEIIANQ